MNAFESISPNHASLWRSWKDDLHLGTAIAGTTTNRRFIPRNFLLDERVTNTRVQSYAATTKVHAGMTFHEWQGEHGRYLLHRVYPTPAAPGYDPFIIHPDDHAFCPETFQDERSLTSLSAADPKTFLIRIIPAKGLQRGNPGVPLDSIVRWAHGVLRNPAASNSDYQNFNTVLENWAEKAQHRPTYAGFWEDFPRLLDPNDKDWADEIRDRMGLYHIGNSDGYPTPVTVLLFRYRVRELPRRVNERDTRPIAIPGVLDGDLNEAFCPAPQELQFGQLLDLSGSTVQPAREILHPFMPFTPAHLFRVSEVRQPVPQNLASARVTHLNRMRQMSNRSDYASATDGVVL